jgi:hypothetical protein
MAAKKVDINIKTTADTTGLQQTTAAAKQLTAATNASNTSSKAMTANTGKAGQIATSAGFQIQDFAVQVGMGTSALTAFGQQAPQLLGVFGPAGAIAGAVVAIGAVAAKVFLTMSEGAQQTSEDMDKIAADLEKAFGDHAKKLVADFAAELEGMTSATKSQREAEMLLFEIRNLQDESNARLIGSNLALEEAGIKYLKTIGLLINDEKALAAVRKEAADKTTAAAIAAENAKAETARKKYEDSVQSYSLVQDELSQAEKRLAELEQQQQAALAQKQISARGDASLVKRGVLKEGQTSVATQAIQGELNTLKSQIEGVYKVIEGAPARLQEITKQSIVQAAELDVALAQSQTAISEITQKADLTARAAELTAATTQITADAKTITEEIAKVEAVGPLQEKAKAQIIQAAADGVITAQEQIAISQNLNVLQTSLKTGQTESLNTVRSLIDLNNDIALKMNALSKELRGLQERVQRIPVR